jgi:hypothetical protein
MRPHFTELQYAYSCTKEIEDDLILPTFGVPYFPSLRDEGKCGFDVKINTIVAPIFLQYKVSDYMVRKKARKWNLFNSAHFRFPIYPADKSPQHNLLKKLSLTQPFVYYCASALEDYKEYEYYHKQRNITSNSAFIPLARLPYIMGSNNHDILFDLASRRGFFCSDPRKIEFLVGWREVLQYVKTNEWGYRYYKELPQSVYGDLIKILDKNMNDFIDGNNLWSNISYILGRYFSVGLITLKI